MDWLESSRKQYVYDSLTRCVLLDLQWGYGGMIIARGSRFFLKFSSVPLAGETDNAYNLQMVTCLLIPTRLKTRGSAE